VAVIALASGAFVPAAHAVPKPKPAVFGTASASPKTYSGACPTVVTLSTTVQVQAPVVLKHLWIFSDGDTTRAKTYRVGGKGLKTVRLSASVKVTGDARGWGAVRLVGPVGKTSKRASFAVDCSGRRWGGRDVWNAVSTSAAQVATPPGQGGGSTQNLVGKATIVFERTTASKCPLTFKIHGSFEGLPAGAQVVQYRLVGTEEWKTVNVPADHGAVFTTVLETLNWDDATEPGRPTASTSTELAVVRADIFSRGQRPGDHGRGSSPPGAARGLGGASISVRLTGGHVGGCVPTAQQPQFLL
jgi:hypothetical protein